MVEVANADPVVHLDEELVRVRQRRFRGGNGVVPLGGRRPVSGGEVASGGSNISPPETGASGTTRLRSCSTLSNFIPISPVEGVAFGENSGVTYAEN